jgi:ribonucleoside-diphosphate reductase alpha chain
MEALESKTMKIKTGCGNLYVTVCYASGEPVQVICRLGKTGGCASALMEGISGVLTYVLSKKDWDIEGITAPLAGIRCPNATISDGKEIESCVDGIAHALAVML